MEAVLLDLCYTNVSFVDTIKGGAVSIQVNHSVLFVTFSLKTSVKLCIKPGLSYMHVQPVKQYYLT